MESINIAYFVNQANYYLYKHSEQHILQEYDYETYSPSMHEYCHKLLTTYGDIIRDGLNSTNLKIKYKLEKGFLYQLGIKFAYPQLELYK